MEANFDARQHRDSDIGEDGNMQFEAHQQDIALSVGVRKGLLETRSTAGHRVGYDFSQRASTLRYPTCNIACFTCKFSMNEKQIFI